MTQFIQLHLLTAYPPANLNRDDMGRPKTALMGGDLRLRVSSQSLKRAWRTSEVFQQALSGHVGMRTRRVGKIVHDRLIAGGVKEKSAKEWAAKAAEQFAKLDKKNDFDTGQLVHLSPDEVAALEQLGDTLAARNEGPTEDELKALRKHNRAADIAMFGRMMADARSASVEAAVQVAHAITVHPVAVEEDYFTAVDDLSDPAKDDAGAAHLGIIEFGAGLFYLYICINRDLLVENLQGDEELARRAIAALIQCAATVAPGGKQASFASRAAANYIMCEVGDEQPRSLAAAFLNAIGARKYDKKEDPDYLTAAVHRLETLRRQFAKAYSSKAPEPVIMNITGEEGNLDAIISHATAAAHR